MVVWISGDGAKVVHLGECFKGGFIPTIFEMQAMWPGGSGLSADYDEIVNDSGRNEDFSPE
jgi:hypothetical protein